MESKITIQVDGNNKTYLLSRNKSVAELRKQLEILMETINKRWNHMDINYLSQQLEKANKLISKIVLDGSWNNIGKKIKDNNKVYR